MSAGRLLVVAILLGACAGSDDDAASTTAASSATTDAPPTTPVTTPVASTAAPTTAPTTTPATTPTTTSTTASTTTPPTTVPEPRFDDWCGLAQAVEAITDGRDDVDFTDPEAVEEYVEPLAALMEQAIPLAPPEIADAVALSAGNTLTLYDALSANGFDVLTLDLAELGLDDAAADEASEAIEAYNADACGIPPDADDDGDGDDPVDLGSGSLRDLFVDQLVAAGFTEVEALCIFGELDFVGEVTDEEVEAAFEACGIGLDRLAELATVVDG
jgi:hypothetical protein